MIDSIIEKAEAAVLMANKGKRVVATGDRFHLNFLVMEIERIDNGIIVVYSRKSRNSLLILKQ